MSCQQQLHITWAHCREPRKMTSICRQPFHCVLYCRTECVLVGEKCKDCKIIKKRFDFTVNEEERLKHTNDQIMLRWHDHEPIWWFNIERFSKRFSSQRVKKDQSDET